MSEESTSQELQSTLLHRGPMTIFEALKLPNGAVHLMRYCCLKMDGAFYIKLGPEETQALRSWMTQGANLEEGDKNDSQMMVEKQLEDLRSFVQDSNAIAHQLYMRGWICIAPQKTPQHIVQDAIKALAQQGWHFHGSEEDRARSLRAAGWQCFEPGKFSLALDEMAGILQTNGYLVYEQLDGHPVLTHEELEAEAARQGYRLEPLIDESILEDRVHHDLPGARAVHAAHTQFSTRNEMDGSTTQSVTPMKSLRAEDDITESPVCDQATLSEAASYEVPGKIPAPPIDATIVEAAEHFWKARYGAVIPADAHLLLYRDIAKCRLTHHFPYWDYRISAHNGLPDYFPHPNEVQW